MSPPLKYKTCTRHNTPNHTHALTFTCYHNLPLLHDDRIKDLLIQSLAAARSRHNFSLSAYVIMPNHVHLLLHPLNPDYSISTLLAGIKRPVAYHARPLLQSNLPHFWQPGGGYDRNLLNSEAILQHATYFHNNPVRAGLCLTPLDWRYSSAAWYEGHRDVPITIDPMEME